MPFCGSLSPEFLRPGRNPRKQPTSRLFGNRYGSSIVRTYVRAICVPTPFTCLSKDTSGYTSLAIFSICSSYSLTRSFSDSISLSSGSRTSRNLVFKHWLIWGSSNASRQPFSLPCRERGQDSDPLSTHPASAQRSWQTDDYGSQLSLR